jgi:endogenous inhibitor of DNA gyrase (YacG/DUF329 family)
MKTAKVIAEAWSVECPHCHQLVENNYGSLMWERIDIENEPTVECPSCGNEIKLPKLPKAVNS